MIDIIKEHPRAVMFAAIIHLIVIIVVGVSVDWTSLSKPTGENKPVKIVNAVAVDQKLVDNELKKIKQAEKKRITKQKDAEKRRKKAIADRKREEKKLKELKNKSKKEQAKQLALKKKRQAEIKSEKARKQKAKKQKQKKQAADRKKTAELAEIKRRQEQFENELKKKLAEEENERKKAIEAANNAKLQKEEGKYIDKIVAHIKSKWNSPLRKSGKIASFDIKVIPGGEVIKVTLKKSSGDAIFDRDVERAIKKASPLPIPPSDSELLNKFRDFTITLEGKG